MNVMLKKFTREKNENSRQIRELLSEIPENNPAREEFSREIEDLRQIELANIDLFNLHFQMANPSISKDLSNLDNTLVNSLEKKRDNFSQLASNPKFSDNTSFLFSSMVKRINFHLYVLEVRNSALSEEEKIRRIEKETLIFLSSDFNIQAILDIHNFSKQALTNLQLESPANKDLANQSIKDISDKYQSIHKNSDNISKTEKSELSNSEKIGRMMNKAISSESSRVSSLAAIALRKIQRSDSTQAESIYRAISLITLNLTERASPNNAECIKILVNNVKQNPTTENKQRLLEDLDNISNKKDSFPYDKLDREAHKELMNSYSYLMKEKGFEIAARERYKACKKVFIDRYGR